MTTVVIFITITTAAEIYLVLTTYLKYISLSSHSPFFRCKN